LLIAHTLRRLKAENKDITELRRENLAALGQPLAREDKHQNPTRLQPAIRVTQECGLCATTVSRPKDPVVGRIQIQETKAFDGAMHLQRVALD
jgi:hypothetical protein